MTAALLAGFVLLVAATFHLASRHTWHRHYRHRIRRPAPYHDRLRHLIAPPR